MTDFDLSKYIYWEYSLAVLFMSEMMKMLLANVKAKWVRAIVFDNPKWMTLIIALLLGIGDWALIDRGQPNYYQLLISFGLAVLGYDYGLKLIKDLYLKIRDAFSSAEPPKPQL